MPIYEYRCTNGHQFEVFQTMSEDPASECRECGAPVERVFHPVAVHFKGSGFYTTDYARKATPAGSDGGGADSSDSKPEKKAATGTDKKAAGGSEKKAAEASSGRDD